MRRFLKFSILMCMILQNVSPLRARPSMALLRWAKTGYLEMSPQVMAAKTPSDLSDSLNSENPFVRASAVRRLGELCGLDAIPQLVQVFRNEEPLKHTETLPIVKMEVVRTLGHLRGAEAMEIMVSLLREHWDRRPHEAGADVFVWMSQDCPVIHCLLEQVSSYAAYETVSTIVEEIALSEELAGMFAKVKGGIGDLAWIAYLHGQMARANINTQKERVDYLVRFREQILEGIQQYTPLTVIKVRAAEAILNTCDLSALQGVLDGVQEEIESKSASFEYNALRVKAAYLKRLIKLRSQDKL
jgi:hypothetical protein